MKDIVFASDLDNTLLYSRSHKREGDICVEHIKGRAHGFMTPLAIERLREVSQKVRLIPVTTRSVEQYRRIEWPEGTAPEYAVTTNGAVLLHGGEVDAAWREAHDALIAPAREEIARCHALYLGDAAFIRCICPSMQRPCNITQAVRIIHICAEHRVLILSAFCHDVLLSLLFLYYTTRSRFFQSSSRKSSSSSHSANTPSPVCRRMCAASSIASVLAAKARSAAARSGASIAVSPAA